MSWTDEELKEKQVRCEKNAEKWEASRSKGMAASNRRVSELHRLARLGLAAEQVGRENLYAAINVEEMKTWRTPHGQAQTALMLAFLEHGAWK